MGRGSATVGSNIDFATAYKRFVEAHLREADGGRQGRLLEGLGHAEYRFLENVWWPAFGDFTDLYSQYEVRDFRDGKRYVDFAFIRDGHRIALEIDGKGPHWREITKQQFSDHLQRQNHLVIDGWLVLRFAYSDIEERPRVCQQTIQQLLGRLSGQSTRVLQRLSLVERELVRLAARTSTPVTPRWAARQLNITPATAARHMRRLMENHWLEPVREGVRIRRYRLHSSRSHLPI